MIRYILVIIFVFYVGNTFASPREIEVWFISTSKNAYFEKKLKIENSYEIYKKIAKLDDMNSCVPMGEGCFNPQTGYIHKKTMLLKQVTRERPKVLKTINAVDTDMIECDKNNYFDIFCGKSKKAKMISKNRIEIWIDTSASLKNIDYSKDNEYCKRRSFVTKVINSCPKDKVTISVYNTSKKTLGGYSNLCMTHGLNNEDRMIKWIKSSDVKKLIIITDIDEYTVKLSNYLESINAKLVGVGINNLYVDEMVKLSKEVVSYCKKLTTP